MCAAGSRRIVRNDQTGFLTGHLHRRRESVTVLFPDSAPSSDLRRGVFLHHGPCRQINPKSQRKPGPENKSSSHFHLTKVNCQELPLLPHVFHSEQPGLPQKKDAFHYLQFVNNYIICEDGLAVHSLFSEIDPEYQKKWSLKKL
jgi:hypothetical protein